MSLANHASRLTATHFCNKIGTEQTKPLPLDVRPVLRGNVLQNSH